MIVAVGIEAAMAAHALDDQRSLVGTLASSSVLLKFNPNSFGI
jgi:hypothetical protein